LVVMPGALGWTGHYTEPYRALSAKVIAMQSSGFEDRCFENGSGRAISGRLNFRVEEEPQ
jgi:hypothetical protein